MGFSKTSEAFSKPTPLVVGLERDGEVWDGENWVSKEEWEKRSTDASDPVTRLLDWVVGGANGLRV